MEKIDGDLNVQFERIPNVANSDRVTVEQWRDTGGRGSIVSEIWLMKEK